jgi:hypothetical protein
MRDPFAFSMVRMVRIKVRAARAGTVTLTLELNPSIHA